MTAAHNLVVDVPAAIQAAEMKVARCRDGFAMEQWEARAKIRDLHRCGYLDTEIAERVGVTTQTVSRILKRPLQAVPDSGIPRLPAPRDITPERSREVEKLADIALGLACRLRDEDATHVRVALSMLSEAAKDELLIIALAGIDIDRPVTDIYGWVLALPAAQEDMA